MNMTDLPLTPAATVLLTSADVEQWKAERAKLQAQQAELAQRLSEVERKLAAAAVFLAEDLMEDASDSASEAEPDDDERHNLTGAIKRVLGDFDRPLSRLAIRYELAKDEVFKDRLSRNPNSYYNALKRLVARGDVVQEGERFRLPEKN